MKFFSMLAAACVAFGATAPVHAQGDFPNRPIRLIVPSTPGTGTDVVARLLATKVKEKAGWTVIVDKTPGGSGPIALGEIVRGKPDGHEWTIGLSSNVTLAPSLM